MAKKSELKKISEEELRQILENHKKWVKSDGKEGKIAVLSNANLNGANLRDVILRRAILSETDLCDADLSSADLSDADLSGTHLSTAYRCCRYSH